MRIAINCRSFLKKQYAGIGRYAHNLVKSLSEIDHQNEYLLYAPKRMFDSQRKAPRIPARNFKVKMDNFNRGLRKTLGLVDIYHSPSPDIIDFPYASTVVTVHDLIYKTYPQGHTADTIAISDKQMKSVTQQAQRIICVSQSTLDDLMTHFPVEPRKVRMIYQGVDKETFYSLPEKERKKAKKVILQLGIVERPYILFVGTLEPRKNLQNLLKAFAILKEELKFDGYLVAVGMKGWMQDDLKQILQTFPFREDVIFPGYITDQELRYLYNFAEVFVFPSFYEGFGYPILEAFCCGCAVVASKTSSCKEIAHDAALLIDPKNPEEMANAIGNLINDATLRASLKEKALVRAGDFSFRSTAEHTLEVYKEVYRTVHRTTSVI